ncbi:TPA_asm: hypothetical protein [Altiarchaeum virus]|nr:TPA_asm: hypothetical protein [Altiarchaeum virus]
MKIEEANDEKLEEIEKTIKCLLRHIFKAFIYFDLIIIFAYISTLGNGFFAYISMMLAVPLIVNVWMAFEQKKKFERKINNLRFKMI